MACVRLQHLQPGRRAAVARLYDEVDPAPMAPFVAMCVVEWETPETVWVLGFFGAVRFRLWRRFAHELHKQGVVNIRAWRAAGRVLPRAVLMPDGSWLARVADYLGPGHAISPEIR